MEMKILFQILFILFQIKLIQNKNCMKYYNFCIQCNEETDLCEYCMFSVFKPDSEGGCVGAKKCIVGNNYCRKCNEDSTKCQACLNAYYPDNNGGCTLAQNCDVSFNGNCQTCLKNYSLVNDGEPYLECKRLPKEEDRIPYCKTYNEEGKCERCIDGYFLSHGNRKCSRAFYCNFVEDDDHCTECIAGFYLDKSDNNICKPYNDSFFYCKESEDGKKCSLCREGFYMAEDNKCVVTDHCVESKPNSYYCKKCEDDYYLTTQGGSCSITKHCKNIISDGKCFICENDYYLNTTEGSCHSNQEDNDLKHCAKASEFCESCAIYYHLGEDKKCSKSRNCSESVDATCVKCSKGSFLTKNNKCVPTDNCIIADDYYQCVECKEGYYYNYTSNECLDDDFEDGKFKNCKNLDYISENCFECRNNYYLNKTDYKCYLAEEDDDLYKCSEINEDNKCVKCEQNYYLGKLDNKCSSIFGCVKSESTDKCAQCDSSYCLTNGLCNYTEFNTENDNGYCYKCKETHSNGIGCKKCFDGFSLSEDGLCTNMEYCEKEKNDVCVKCKSNIYDEVYGLYLSFCANKKYGCVENSDDKCIRCDDIYDFDKCSECIKSYRVEDGECVPCKEGCGDCTQEDNCASCLEGYFVKNEESLGTYDVECEKCLDGCKKCENDFECDECFEGFYLTNKKSEEGTLECAACSEGCIDCYDENNCLECKDGYNLVEDGDKMLCEED